MSTDQSNSLPPERDDRDVAELLQRAFGQSGPRSEFVASLRETSRRELQSHLTAACNGNGTETTRHREAISNAPLKPRRRRGRSLLAAAVAVVMVLAAFTFNSRPSYSWSLMVEALERRPWIETTSVAEDGRAEGDVRNWFSRVHRVFIRQSPETIEWDDWEEGVRSFYQAGSGVLLRNRLARESGLSVERSLLSRLIRSIIGEPTAESDSDRIDIIRQSWHEVEIAGRARVELDVLLQWNARPGETFRLVLLLDPETHLPHECRLIGEDGESVQTVRMDFPQQGPADVYDIGVPHSVVIQDETSSVTSEPIVKADSLPETPMITADTLKTIIVEAPEPAVRVAELAATSSLGIEDIATPTSPAAPARPVPVSSAEMADRIDSLLEALWEQRGIAPVESCTDLEFLRRVYLDLTGRVPTVSEVREFLADNGSDRRGRLVEQLLQRRDHATHLAAVWRRFLLPEGVDLSQYGGTASFEEWLGDHFRKNTPYDEVVRELLLAEGRVSESGPILFYTALKLAPEQLAAQTSRAFLGVRLECAQCHDHFFDKRWKQTDFWGYAAFFARISRPEGKMEMISPVLQVKDSDRGEVTLPEQETIISPRLLLGDIVPDGSERSRRQELADWMTAPENPHFARATVNRVWAHVFGRGLVEPVDDMRDDHPPICPEVLEDLAAYFVATDFNLQELFRVIVLSRTYQRSSSAPDDDSSRAEHFAQMNIKSFTAEQLYDSIAVATRLEMPAETDGSLVRAAGGTRQAFLETFRTPPGAATDYQAGIPQALTLMNGMLIQGATGLKSSGILRALEAPFFSDEQRVETLFLATLSRPPDDAERQQMLEYVTSGEGDRSERLGDILWALLNTAEFTMNH